MKLKCVLNLNNKNYRFNKIVLFEILCACLFFIAMPSQADPLLVVVMMVKNEEPVMRQTLKSYIDGGIDSFFIFDTGSTDNTVHITQKFLEDHGIKNVGFAQEKFIDFATSRNRALALAQEKFLQADFFLMPDAEWSIENPQLLLQFCALHRNEKTVQAYPVRMVRDNVYDYFTTRLMRPGARFVGVVHEVLDAQAGEKVPHEAHFTWHRSSYGLEKSRERWHRDISLLLKAFADNPHDPRTAFYIAQTYSCLQEWELARDWYMKRLAMPGWDEENYVACFRLAQTYETLHDWHNALVYYLKAFSLRPHRAEALISLAQHYWDSKEYELCYLFAKRATELPYPYQDILFIEKELYDFTRFDLLGRSGWYVGDYDNGQRAMLQAIAARPHYDYLYENLAYYNRNKKTSS